MREHESMTAKQKKMYLFLIDYGFEVQKRSGCSSIGLPKDLILENLEKLQKITKETE